MEYPCQDCFGNCTCIGNNFTVRTSWMWEDLLLESAFRKFRQVSLKELLVSDLCSSSDEICEVSWTVTPSMSLFSAHCIMNSYGISRLLVLLEHNERYKGLPVGLVDRECINLACSSMELMQHLELQLQLWTSLRVITSLTSVRLLEPSNSNLIYTVWFTTMLHYSLKWWSLEVLVLLSGLLPNPKLETSVLTICLTISTLHFTVPYGIGAAASTRVSNELGAGNPQAARVAVWTVIFLAALEAVIVSTTLFFIFWGTLTAMTRQL